MAATPGRRTPGTDAVTSLLGTTGAYIMPKPINPVPNNDECEWIVSAHSTGVLVMCQDSVPYAVPMNHAWSDGSIYFHCAPAGRKLDMIRANPNVCYVVNGHFGQPSDLSDPRKCHGNWESLVAYGKARVVEDSEELREAFLTFGRYYDPDFELSEEAAETTSAVILAVEAMTARREGPDQSVDYWSWAPAVS
jgi:nitroimidazol reductase NimA-like FMN-containing flavoprotein (pyridoxamine 5'-phosphate oxidase superfamily)